MKFIVITVILTFCIIGVFSSILEEQHRNKFRLIRNVCLVQSGVTPYDLVIARKAVGPAEKLVRASHCIIEQLSEQQNDEVAQAIIEHTREAIRNTRVPELVNSIIVACGNLLGRETCQQLIELIQVAVDAAVPSSVQSQK